MALMDFIKKQFIDILEWTEDDNSTVAWRYPIIRQVRQLPQEF